MTDHPPSDDPRRHELFMRHFTANQRHIYLYIRSLTSSTADCEEIFQQTNLLLWQKFDTFTPGTNFKAWAFRIAWFEVRNHRSRSGKGNVRFTDAFLGEVAAEAERQSDQIDARLAALSQCLAKLTAQDRRIIQHRYAEGASGRQVAEAIGRPTRWVYKAVTRIRRSLIECVRQTVRRQEAT